VNSRGAFLKEKRNTMSEMVILDAKKKNVPGPSAYKVPDLFSSLK